MQNIISSVFSFRNLIKLIISYFERFRVNDDDGFFSIPFIFDDEKKSAQSSSA
jgi:hypothetical protein